MSSWVSVFWLAEPTIDLDFIFTVGRGDTLSDPRPHWLPASSSSSSSSGSDGFLEIVEPFILLNLPPPRPLFLSVGANETFFLPSLVEGAVEVLLLFDGTIGVVDEGLP